MHMSDVETGNIALILINWITNKFFLKSFGRMKKKGHRQWFKTRIPIHLWCFNLNLYMYVVF